MDEQTKLAVAEALYNAIAETVAHEYHEIMWNGLPIDWTDEQGPDPDQECEYVEEAIDSLHSSLRKGEPPDYDNQLVPLFYSTWYQPFQINIAYSLVMRIAQNRDGVLTDKRALHVVDFGCGALAMKFGLAIAAMDLREQGYMVPEILIDLIDSSMEMITIGELIWERFAQTLVGNQTFEAIRGLIRTRQIDTERIRTIDTTECWLTALHAFYDKYKDQIRQDLGSLYQTLKPSVGLITFHTMNQDVVDYASPFLEIERIDIPPLLLTGNLPATTRWRQARGELLGNDFLWKRLVSASQVDWDPVPQQNDTRIVIGK